MDSRNRILTVLPVGSLVALAIVVSAGCETRGHYAAGWYRTVPVPSETSHGGASPRRGKVDPSRDTLGARRVTLSYEQAPLDDVTAAVRSVAGVNIVISPLVYRDRAPEELLVTLSLRDVTIATALDWITRLVRLRWCVDYGVVYITLPEDAPRTRPTRVYSVGDQL